MLIKVSDIPEEGLSVELAETADSLEGLGADLRPKGPVRGEFHLKMVGSTVFVTGTVEAALELDCSRCGKSFETTVEAGFRLDLNPVETLAGEEEKELREGDLDVGFFSGGVVDLTALLAEQLALNVPMKPLCSEDCRGICQFCGQDKNVKDCGCEPPSGHPGLEGLKDLLEKMKEEGAKEDGESD